MGGPRDPALEVLDALAARYAFSDVAALVAGGACGASRTKLEALAISQLCTFGQRLLDLDAEDFGVAPGPIAGGFAAVPPELVARSGAARMPRSPREVERGALTTLRPSYALLLEVIEVRWMRHEASAVLAALHIASEFLSMLIWEPVLGHACDPARMSASVGGKGSRWGKMRDGECPHSSVEKSAARRSLRANSEPDAGWIAYLDGQHSIVSLDLGVCAGRCRTRCPVISQHTVAEQARLHRACRVGEEFTESTLIRLRHRAPVGHGFGVPSLNEVLAEWAHTRQLLSARTPAALIDDGYVLPGLPSLFSALADAQIKPDTMLAETVSTLREALR